MLLRSLFEFFKPTLPKGVFILEWSAYYGLFVVWGGQKSPQQLAVGLWPLAPLYGLGCALVKWSQRTTRVAGGRGMAAFAVALVAGDQIAKFMVERFLPPNAPRQILGDWLHVTHVRHAGGSLLAPARLAPLLMAMAIVVLLLAVVIYRYTTASNRRSLWVDLAFLGIFAGYGSWLVDMAWRRTVLDFLSIPELVAFDLKDVFLLVGGAAFVVEVIENSNLSWRWAGWRQEIAGVIQLVQKLYRFCRLGLHIAPQDQTAAQPDATKEGERHDRY